jgi:hypothetical protein
MKLKEVTGNIVGLSVKTDEGIMVIKSGWAAGLWLRKPDDKSGQIFPYTKRDFLELEVIHT